MPDRPELHDHEAGGLKVSTYDKATGFLIATLILVGGTVLLLFIVWLTTRITFRQMALPVVLVEEPAGRGEAAEGYASDLEEPGLEELEEVLEPALEATMEAVTDVVSSQSASLDALNTDAVTSGHGSGLGDSRQAGPGGDGEDIIPRWERWLIRFETTDQNAYAAQLDFFRIELGAVSFQNPNIQYATKLSSNRPTTRAGTRDQENETGRIYFSWKNPASQALDRMYLQKAGINMSGPAPYQFYHKDTENLLATVELDYAKKNGHSSVVTIKQTIFVITGDPGSYQFVVSKQTYR